MNENKNETKISKIIEYKKIIVQKSLFYDLAFDKRQWYINKARFNEGRHVLCQEFAKFLEKDLFQETTVHIHFVLHAVNGM